jgi:hypothetical protein
MLVGVAALNVIVVALLRGYDYRAGPVHFVAHDAFKPLQYLAAAVVIALVLRGTASIPAGTKAGVPVEDESAPGWLTWTLPVCVVAGYLPTMLINFAHPDWIQAHIGASVHGFKSVVSWFVDQKADGFYRPLGYLSIWLDYLLFRTAPAGYHLQNIALHALNVVLARALYSRLGFSRAAANSAALLFAVAPVCVEPMAWPATRYDLLATAFVLGTLISAADWLRREQRGRTRLLIVAALTAAGILSKETGYAAPLLVALLALFWKLRGLAGRRPITPLLVATGAPAALGIFARLLVYHGMGGYSYAQGVSPVLTFSAKSVLAVVTRLLVIPFALNTADGITLLAAAVLALFACASFIGALLYAGRLSREDGVIVGATVLSALPVAAILGWVGPSMAESRYLYFPSIWTFALLGRILSARRMKAVFALFLLGTIGATASNLLKYRDALATAERCARTVQAEQSHRGVDTVCLAGVPSASNGVLFFGYQVLDQVRSSLRGRGTAVLLAGVSGCKASGETLVYRWNPATRDLELADSHKD